KASLSPRSNASASAWEPIEVGRPSFSITSRLLRVACSSVLSVAKPSKSWMTNGSPEAPWQINVGSQTEPPGHQDNRQPMVAWKHGLVRSEQGPQSSEAL